MRPFEHGYAPATLLLLSASVAPACLTDSVPPDIYASPARSPADAAARDAGARNEPADQRATDTGPSGSDDAGANLPAPGTGGDSGPCDLTGHWLISQRQIAQGLGVRQAGLWWYYYELEQSGGTITVKKGLVCGGEVRPVDLLAAAVEWSAAWPAITAKNSHAGRRGTVTSAGSDCMVSFERAYAVVGATTPYYADARNPLPSVDQKGSGDTPGWEDWDGDGQPAVSLIVSGIVTGTRYTALRAWNEWSGKISAGATNFKLPSTWNQDEAILGATSDLLKQTGVPDADRSLHFAQFARLMPDQVQGDPEAMCATVRSLAPTLTSDADQ